MTSDEQREESQPLHMRHDAACTELCNFTYRPDNRGFYLSKLMVVLIIDLLYVFCVVDSELETSHQNFSRLPPPTLNRIT